MIQQRTQVSGTFYGSHICLFVMLLRATAVLVPHRLRFGTFRGQA